MSKHRLTGQPTNDSVVMVTSSCQCWLPWWSCSSILSLRSLHPMVVMLQDLVPEEPSSHVVMLQDLVPEEPSPILSLRSLHPMCSKVQHLVPEKPSSHLVPEEPSSHVVMLQDLVPEEPLSHVVMLQDLFLRSLHPMWSCSRILSPRILHPMVVKGPASCP